MSSSDQQIAVEFLLQEGTQVRRIATDKINFIEAQHGCSQINSEGRGYLMNQRLADIESQLDPDAFVRIDRCYILNLGCINSIRQGIYGHNVMLNDGTFVPVTPGGYEKLRRLIG